MDATLMETARYFRGRYGTDVWNWWVNQDYGMRVRFVAARHTRLSSYDMAQALEAILSEEGIVPHAEEAPCR